MLSLSVIAVVYVVVGWSTMRRGLPSGAVASVPELVGPRWYTQAFAVLVSCFGLAGGLVVGISDSTAGTATRGLAAAAIVLSWLLLHTAFAQIYAREHVSEAGWTSRVAPTRSSPNSSISRRRSEPRLLYPTSLLPPGRCGAELSCTAW